MSLKDCIIGLKWLSQCFQIAGDYNPSRGEYPKCRKICNDSQLPQKTIDSNFSAWLLKRMKKYSSIS